MDLDAFEEEAFQDWLTDFEKDARRNMVPVVGCARAIFAASISTLEEFEVLIERFEEELRQERRVIIFEEAVCYWSHMTYHQSLVNTAEHRVSEISGLLSALITQIGLRGVSSSEMTIDDRASFVELLNTTEKAYSLSRIKHSSLGFDGLHLDVSRRIADRTGLSGEWDNVRTFLVRFFERQWKQTSFRITLIRFNIS